MRSLKFVFLPPVSFHFSVGFKNLFKKIKLKNALSLLTFGLKDMIPCFKRIIRLILPLGLRKGFALWLNHQPWLSSYGYLIEGVIRDLLKSDPKAFHKFMSANHICTYAHWYDSETLFESVKMNGSTAMRREFFNDLIDVIKSFGLDLSVEIRSVLEIGCSLGYLLRFMEKDIFQNLEVVIGIDIDSDAINKGTHYLSKVGSKVHLIHGDMEELERLVGNHSFDIVFSAGALSYLNEIDAAKVVSKMLHRTSRILALVGLASKSVNNRELSQSLVSVEDHNQWIHNFEAMIEAANGCVIASRWEGDKQSNDQPIYFVFAVPKAMCALGKLDRHI